MPVFSGCSVQVVLHVDVFFDVFVGGANRDLLFLCHLTLPSHHWFLSLPTCKNNVRYFKLPTPLLKNWFVFSEPE